MYIGIYIYIIYCYNIIIIDIISATGTYKSLVNNVLYLTI